MNTQTQPKRTNWTPEEIKARLLSDEKWLQRGLLAIYDRQTADEKATEDTKHLNGIGFNGADAKILSSLAKWARRTGFLTPKQVALARRRMAKYSGQLARIANGE